MLYSEHVVYTIIYIDHISFNFMAHFFNVDYVF